MAQATTPRPPKRPAHLPHGRWLGDLGRLSAAEKALVKACAEGRIWGSVRWDGKSRPEKSTPTNTIRGELIRFLALGGDTLNPVHELGVMARGAWISGTLNLHQARAAVRLDLRHCHFVVGPDFMAAHLPELVLIGSAMPELWADRLIVTAGVYLRGGFEATGSVRLAGAQIGGDLDCTNGKFINEGGEALCADRINVRDSVHLSDGFEASGSVRLAGAQIGGAFDCTNGRFLNEGGNALNVHDINVTGGVYLREGFEAKGSVQLIGAQIGRDLDCTNGKFTNEGGKALCADGIKITGSLFVRDTTFDGAILLAAAKLGTLIDDLACWTAGRHIFDGLHYDRIIGPTDAASRIAWLKSQLTDQLTTNFKPQPWEQLIKVLREMGHPFEAGEIAIAKQEQMRLSGVIKGPVRKGLHWLYGKMAGYGHRPIRTVGWMAVVWFLMSVAFWVGADQFAAIGPSNPTITSEALYPDAGKLCGHGNELAKESGKARWTECPGVPDEYSTFQPFIYSLDLILPLVDLQQDSDWAPIAEGPTGKDLLSGVILRWLMWFEILFGWAASLMLVAVLGRLVEKD